MQHWMSEVCISLRCCRPAALASESLLTVDIDGVVANYSSTIPGDGRVRAKWHMPPKQAPAEAQLETRRQH